MFHTQKGQKEAFQAPSRASRAADVAGNRTHVYMVKTTSNKGYKNEQSILHNMWSTNNIENQTSQWEYFYSDL